MAQYMQLNAPAGAGFPSVAAPSAAYERAMAALAAGRCSGFVWPTYGAAGDLAVIEPDFRGVQDALFANIWYQATSLTSGLPVVTTSSTAPSMSWAGVSGARGLRAEDLVQTAQWQCAAGAVGANPDFWIVAAAQLGTLDGGTQVIGGVNTSYTGYGEALIQGPTGVIELRLGSGNSFGFSTASGDNRTVPHLFGARYTRADDTVRLYLDGVLTNSYVVQTHRPGTAFVGGAGYFGGRAGSLAQEQLDAANSAFRAMAFGNGTMSDQQWLDLQVWLKAALGIA